MRLKANVFSSIALISLIFALPLFPADDVSYQIHERKLINSILTKEKNQNNLKSIIEIIDLINATYGDLYNKLKNGGKITIYIDPAHGRLDNGKWQGEATDRISSTGLPEEYYSIQFSRKFYKLFSCNKFIDVISNDEYMRVLKGESDDYKNTSFPDTVKMAQSQKALLIISEHLNNISVIKKADGVIDIPGIHITRDEAGNRYLTYINSSYEGFLTLYNKYDSSGFSKNIAHKIKEDIPQRGIKLNNWEFGAVADDRFSYFIDFPISVIFESGFISNPVEEIKLRDPEYQQKIIESQYIAILDSIKKIFGIDISGSRLKRVNDNTDFLDLIKLSRISIYYLKNDFPEKAIDTINEIEKNYKSLNYPIESYLNLRERITNAENFFKKCKNLQKANRLSRAKDNLYKAAKALCNEPIFSALADKYSQYANKHFGIKNIACTKKESLIKNPVPYHANKASLNTPVILVIEKNQTLRDALDKALSPDPETALLLINSFNYAYTRKKVKIEKYSEKSKKIISCWKWGEKKVDFNEGLYIITLDKNLKITRLRRVSQVLLDPDKYQNHQYLKNSYFASIAKQKSL